MIELSAIPIIFYPTKKIIHIDIDPASISKRVKIDVPIVGSVKSVLEDMLVIYESLKTTHDKNNQKRMDDSN